jgi:hypothetical protein
MVAVWRLSGRRMGDAVSEKVEFTNEWCMAAAESEGESDVAAGTPKRKPPEVVRIGEALHLIGRYGGIDGAHHKQWVLDQVARKLAGDKYEAWVRAVKEGEDGPDTYEWDEGIAP